MNYPTPEKYEHSHAVPEYLSVPQYAFAHVSAQEKNCIGCGKLLRNFTFEDRQAIRPTDYVICCAGCRESAEFKKAQKAEELSRGILVIDVPDPYALQGKARHFMMLHEAMTLRSPEGLIKTSPGISPSIWNNANYIRMHSRLEDELNHEDLQAARQILQPGPFYVNGMSKIEVPEKTVTYTFFVKPKGWRGLLFRFKNYFGFI